MRDIPFRTGFGIDFHRLVADRPLWIGGVQIPHHKGALGHSDADVLLHAICDALLGAAALGDIGLHFPDTDPAFKDIDSKILLKETIGMIRQAGFELGNIDATVCLEVPQLKPYKEKMQEVIADITGMTKNDISIKATTAEQMGFVGREEGIAAYATVLLIKK